MASSQDNQKSTPEFIEFLKAEGNSRTLTSEATKNAQESSQIDLELSLGSWCSESKTTSTEGPSNVGVAAEILETSNPISSEVAQAAQSAARNPAFLRAIRYINSESRKRRLSRSCVTEGVASVQIASSSLPTPQLPSHRTYTYQIDLPISQTHIPTYSISTITTILPDTTLTLGIKRDRSDSEEGIQRNVLPEVRTDGGISGNAIYGVLCKQNKEEVLIRCACHYKVFTPGGFVRHAGGGDVENPSSLIKMVGVQLVENENVTLS